MQETQLKSYRQRLEKIFHIHMQVKHKNSNSWRNTLARKMFSLLLHRDCTWRKNTREENLLILHLLSLFMELLWDVCYKPPENNKQCHAAVILWNAEPNMELGILGCNEEKQTEIHYRTKVWCRFLKKASSAHQGGMHLIKNAVKTVQLCNIITIAISVWM